MDFILGCLKNCSIVRTHSPLKYGGPWGRLMLIGWIAGLFTFPEYYLKRGEASAEDLNNFPVDLRKKLVMLKMASFVLMAALVVLFVLVVLSVNVIAVLVKGNESLKTQYRAYVNASNSVTAELKQEAKCFRLHAEAFEIESMKKDEELQELKEKA